MQKQKQNEFVNMIQQFRGKYQTWQIFADFITMFACAISNAVDKTHAEKREKMYLEIIRKYDKNERMIFPQMCTAVTEGIKTEKDCDFLGELYMALELGNHWKGQFFTPYHLCRAMAKINSIDVEEIKQKGYISVNDMACGAGALLIAYANEAEER